MSNKARFEYFSRTIPSDHYQTMAMAKIVEQLKWTYLSVVYEESSYGVKVREAHCFNHLLGYTRFDERKSANIMQSE